MKLHILGRVNLAFCRFGPCLGMFAGFGVCRTKTQVNCDVTETTRNQRLPIRHEHFAPPAYPPFPYFLPPADLQDFLTVVGRRWKWRKRPRPWTGAAAPLPVLPKHPSEKGLPPMVTCCKNLGDGDILPLPAVKVTIRRPELTDGWAFPWEGTTPVTEIVGTLFYHTSCKYCEKYVRLHANRCPRKLWTCAQDVLLSR